MKDPVGVHEALWEDAVFLGWQPTPAGTAFSLYNIILKSHPSYHSTVTERTLRKLGLKIPPTPAPPPRDSRTFAMTINTDTVPSSSLTSTK
jgi:hypothetical protein